jgi:hypothetical protein
VDAQRVHPVADELDSKPGGIGETVDFVRIPKTEHIWRKYVELVRKGSDVVAPAERGAAAEFGAVKQYDRLAVPRFKVVRAKWADAHVTALNSLG